MPRALLLVLLGLLALLQYQLWLGDGGISERRSLESQVASDSKENQSLRHLDRDQNVAKSRLTKSSLGS